MHSDVPCNPGMQTTTRLQRATVTAKPLRRSFQYYSGPQSIAQHYKVLHNILQSTTPYYTVLLRTAQRCSILQSTVPYCKVLRRIESTAPYYKVLLRTTKYYSALQSTTPYYKVLLRTILFFELLVSTSPLHRETFEP